MTGIGGEPPADEAAGCPGAAVRKPLRWRCRRGMKELDVLLERFARRALPQASPADCQVFAQVLELPDPLLAGYLLGGETPAEPHLAQAIARMRALCRLDDGSAVFCR
jgi:antitoxin CptB